MSSNETIFKFADSWLEHFDDISNEDYVFYYFSLHYNDSPVYRIYLKKCDVNYDIYKLNNRWYVSNSFTSIKSYDYSLSKNSLASEVLPPKTGWNNPYFKNLFNDVMTKYHIRLALIDSRFSGWLPKYAKYTPIKMKQYFMGIILNFKRFVKCNFLYLPNEMIYMIFNNFKPIEFSH